MDLNKYKLMQQTFASAGLSDRSNYSRWLSEQYHLVKHSINLLHTCASHSYFTSKPLSDYMTSLIGGELHHDKLLLNDLKYMKESYGPASTAVESIIAKCYYEIEKGSPYYFLGYIYMLERLAIEEGIKLCEEVKMKFGGGYSFLKVHGADDIEHIKEAEKYLETLTPEQRQGFQKGLDQCSELYQQAIAQLASDHRSQAA
jgi:hypothetical protein